eukprot:Clim_evm25s154 gene=Clim_evmTU25s154
MTKSDLELPQDVRDILNMYIMAKGISPELIPAMVNAADQKHRRECDEQEQSKCFHWDGYGENIARDGLSEAAKCLEGIRKADYPWWGEIEKDLMRMAYWPISLGFSEERPYRTVWKGHDYLFWRPMAECGLSTHWNLRWKPNPKNFEDPSEAGSFAQTAPWMSQRVDEKRKERGISINRDGVVDDSDQSPLIRGWPSITPVFMSFASEGAPHTGHGGLVGTVIDTLGGGEIAHWRGAVMTQEMRVEYKAPVKAFSLYLARSRATFIGAATVRAEVEIIGPNTGPDRASKPYILHARGTMTYRVPQKLRGGNFGKLKVYTPVLAALYGQERESWLMSHMDADEDFRQAWKHGDPRTVHDLANGDPGKKWIMGGPKLHERYRPNPETVPFLKALTQDPALIHFDRDLEPGMRPALGLGTEAYIDYHPKVVCRQFHSRATDDPHVHSAVVFTRYAESVNGIAHGGSIYTTFDTTMSGIQWILGYQTLTAYLTVRYFKAVPLHRCVQFRARLEHRDGRKLYIRSIADDPESGEVYGEAEGLWLIVKESYEAGPHPNEIHSLSVMLKERLALMDPRQSNL